MKIINYLFLLMIIFLFNSCKPIIKCFYGEKIYKTSFMVEPSMISQEIELPYEIIDNQIILPIYIDKIKYNFIFDTGAPISLISQKIKLLNHVSLGNSLASDANNSKFKNELINYDLSIGMLFIKNFPLSVTNLDTLNDNSCVEVDGVIGSNILNQGVFMFNHKRKVLVISNSSTDNLNNGIDLSLKMGNLGLFIQNEKYSLDSGFGGFILNNTNSKISNNTIQNKNFITKLNALNSSKNINGKSFVNLIKIGNKNYKGVIDLVSDKSKHGLIGVELFLKNDVTIDYKNKKIFIDNRDFDILSEDIEIPNISFQIIKSNITIKTIVLNSKFDKEGIKIGGIVLKLNNKILPFFENNCDFKNFLKGELDLNNSLTLEILNNDNSIKKITYTKKELYEYPVLNN